MEDNIYNNALRKIDNDRKCRPLCCAGPTGPIGPTGPTGPSGITLIPSILVDNDGIQTVGANSLVNLGTITNTTGTGITFTTPNTVNLTAGSYYILYKALINNGEASGDVGASLQIDGVTADNASEYVPATTTQTQIILQHNITVTEPTTVTVLNGSTVANNFHDSSLSVIKLG